MLIERFILLITLEIAQIWKLEARGNTTNLDMKQKNFNVGCNFLIINNFD